MPIIYHEKPWKWKIGYSDAVRKRSIRTCQAYNFLFRVDCTQQNKPLSRCPLFYLWNVWYETWILLNIAIIFVNGELDASNISWLFFISVWVISQVISQDLAKALEKNCNIFCISFVLICTTYEGSFKPYSAGMDFSRQNLTSVDVRFWRLKSLITDACESCINSAVERRNQGMALEIHPKPL